MVYDMSAVLGCILDGGLLDEFQPGVARELLCGHAHIEGRPVALLANSRGIIKGKGEQRPRFGGIIYTESAEKAAFFIETASRERLPLLFIQDVSGFMVGPEAEQSGIIRAGANVQDLLNTSKLIDNYTISALLNMIHLGVCKVTPELEPERC